jgi:ADP-ribose pyrophosphatase YjhB (NUDIX family)
MLMSDNHDLQNQLFLLADAIRGQANIGRHFANDHYEKERAHTILKLAAKLAALANGDISSEAMQRRFDENVFHMSPLIGVDAAVFNEAGEILLMERADGLGHAMPGGLAEIGLTLPQSVLKELWEEVGMRGEVVRLLGVFNGPDWKSHAPMQSQLLVFLIQCEDLTPQPGLEALSAGYFAKDNIPDKLHPSHRLRLPLIFEMYETGGCYHDPASSDDIDLMTFQQRDES